MNIELPKWSMVVALAISATALFAFVFMLSTAVVLTPAKSKKCADCGSDEAALSNPHRALVVTAGNDRGDKGSRGEKQMR